MFGVGKISEQAQELCDATLNALETAITQCGPGVPFRMIGQVTYLRPTKELCNDVSATHGLFTEIHCHSIWHSSLCRAACQVPQRMYNLLIL
jgi:Xaa-Pro aminopeptidase